MASKIKILKRETVWSGFLFLVPLYFAIHFNLYFFASILGVATIISFFYHTSAQRKFRLADETFAWAAMIGNTVLCYLGNFSPPYFYFALVFAFLAILFFKREEKHGYERNHALWHLFSSLLTIFCILTFVF